MALWYVLYISSRLKPLYLIYALADRWRYLRVKFFPPKDDGIPDPSELLTRILPANVFSRYLEIYFV